MEIMFTCSSTVLIYLISLQDPRQLNRFELYCIGAFLVIATIDFCECLDPKGTAIGFYNDFIRFGQGNVCRVLSYQSTIP